MDLLRPLLFFSFGYFEVDKECHHSTNSRWGDNVLFDIKWTLFSFSKIVLSTSAKSSPPTYLSWTIVDILRTTHPPPLVHVVIE